MATNLHDLSIGAPDDGFAQLLHINGGITGALKTVYDGDATATIVELSSAAFNITGAGTFQYGGVAVTSTAAELNILDGVTSTAAELNILDGVTTNTTELNYLDGTTLGTAVASKVLACDASKDLNLNGGDFTAVLGTFTGNLTVNSNYVMEGYATGRNVMRVTYIKIEAGGTPGTNLTVSDISTTNNTYNSVSTLTTSTNITSGGGAGGGSFSFINADLTMNLTETVIGPGAISPIAIDVENSDATALYTFDFSLSSGNMKLTPYKNGSNTVAANWVNVLTTAGDKVHLKIVYWTST